MPQSLGKKGNCEKESLDASQSDDSSGGVVNTQLNNSGSSNSSGKCRKRKHSDIVRFSDLESEFEDCDLEDAAALETKLRKVARRNSLTHDEMMKLLHKFVKNEHILALVTLKAEDELAKERKFNEEQRAIIITEIPSVPKLTRAKARELNKTSIIKLPSLKHQDHEPEIAALIKDDLHSDEEDDEYIFKDEDFVSDDDPSTAASDIESNPPTPQTPASLFDVSPVKLSDDGCFKVPLNKKCQELSEELRIAARTRSKFCLQQTTIEDLQSEFIPPDVEDPFETSDLQTIDDDWMQFLNDFTKPLSANLVADDDDLINDPEYVAAEKVPVDAEELRDVNISKKELSELLAELYDGLMSEGLSMESIDLDTPRKFLLSSQEDELDTPNTSPKRLENNLNVSKHEFSQLRPTHTQVEASPAYADRQEIIKVQPDYNITPINSHHDYTFHPDIMSTPSARTKQFSNNNNMNNNELCNINSDSMALIPIAQSENEPDANNGTVTIASSSLNTKLELIAVPIPGQPNCFQLAKVADSQRTETDAAQPSEMCDVLKHSSSSKSLRYNKPYEINYTCNYISVRRHIIAEYIDKFKSLQQAQDNQISSTTPERAVADMPNICTSFTQYQYDLMQQQLRIHIQQVTQTFVQTYCHPELWKLAPKAKGLLLDLKEKAKDNVNFQVWNLQPATELIHNWQNELDQNTPENTELMNFLHHENVATNHQSRQIPRFHPRILDCYLNSPVFMYPQYLPRMPFTAKPSIPIFSPVEAYLIAMGLEKHLQIIYEKKEKISSKTTPLRVACKRLAKDTVCGKRYRRIWDHILHLQKADYYNPIKYFFEHNKAPPVDHDPVWTFNNNVVLPPKDRIPELPLVFQTYLQKKNEPPKQNKKTKSRKQSVLKVSDTFRNSYLEFVQEAVGRAIHIPNLFHDPAESAETPLSDSNSNNNFAEKRHSKPKTKKKVPQSFTINVNYVYTNGLDVSTTSQSGSLTSYSIDYPQSNLLKNPQQAEVVELTSEEINTSNKNLPDSTINSTIELVQNHLEIQKAISDCSVPIFNFDWRTKNLQPAYDIKQTKINQHSLSTNPVVGETLPTHIVERKVTKLRTCRKIGRTLTLQKRIKRKALAYREKRHLRRRCVELITTYSLYLDRILQKYKHHPLIGRYYRQFKALELYTYLLKSLKAICNKTSNIMSNSSNNSPSSLKRTRNTNSNTDDDNNSPSSTRQVRKLNRQEENFRHMLLPDTPEETNRKDAIYAFNFYEKVEESFKAANKPEDCKKFNDILKSFDPKKDKVSELYYKLEKLFLPDHPELAQVFLTFLLPSEATEIGKFFEHFMINNMGTFINKLNIYFNKQPAQIRKIYNCLNDLAEDPDVTMKTVETKIVPLLKGNQFLVDWFMQQFSQSTPPERLYSQPEHINLKDQQCNRTGEYVETVTDLMDSPTSDAQQSCQLRYINGRIFYGSKMILPAKLSFMAASYRGTIQNGTTSSPHLGCVHGIREHGEKSLQAAAVLTSAHINSTEHPSSDDQDKSEEEDVSKALVIDTTADEEDSCSSVELCDEATLRAHAARLNPSVYSSTCYTSTHINGTPNLTPAHHTNTKRAHLNLHDEAKISPRKSSLLSLAPAQQHFTSPLATAISNSSLNSKEKRKSPSKKSKSPLNSGNNKTLRANNVAPQPMVVIHETNSAIQCAKRLKSLIDGEEQHSYSVEDIVDSKDIIKIVARSKNSLQVSPTNAPTQICEEVKEEKSEDLEFIAGHSAISASPFPCLRIETDSNEEDPYNSKTPPPRTTQLAPPNANNDECKIEIVSSLTTEPGDTASTLTSDDKSLTDLTLNAAWTRDEDKIILIEMKMGSQNRNELFDRIAEKLPNRTRFEVISRHQFLMDFLSKLQGN